MEKFDSMANYDLWKDGFEAGIQHTFRYIPEGSLTYEDLVIFTDYIELTCPWKTFEGWNNLIVDSYRRITKEVYEDCKRMYAENRVKYADNSDLMKFYDRHEKKLEERWRRIVEAGLEEPIEGRVK